jgi:hypothetical protein
MTIKPAGKNRLKFCYLLCNLLHANKRIDENITKRKRFVLVFVNTFKKIHVAMEIKGPEKPIYSIEVTKATRHDSPLLIPLLEQINGEIGDVCGDKGPGHDATHNTSPNEAEHHFSWWKRTAPEKAKDTLPGERCTNPEKKTKNHGTNDTTNAPTAKQDSSHLNNKPTPIFPAETGNFKPTKYC